MSLEGFAARLAEQISTDQTVFKAGYEAGYKQGLLEGLAEAKTAVDEAQKLVKELQERFT